MMRLRRSKFPLIFVVFAVAILLFTLYNVLTPHTYTVPHEQHIKPLWKTWETSKDEEESKRERERWDGTTVCNSSPSRTLDEPLRFQEDGSFRIAIFTDVHFSCGHKCTVDHNSQLLMDSILEMERPDLVVFNGDLIQSEGDAEKPHIFLDVFASVERRGIPFAVIFGNHDSDGPVVMTRQELVRLANKCPHSITMSLDEFRKNEGNYIRLLEGKTTTQLLFLETNRDIMTNTQEKWLRETMDEIQSKDEKNYLSTLVFMHIPSKEFVTKLCAKDTVCNGMYGERTEYGGKGKKNGFYEIFQSMKGEVRAVISGHDHKNDLCSVHEEEGGEKDHPTVEVLCYARASGYGGYGYETLAKGARMIHLNEATHSIFSYVVQETGERSQMLQFIYPR